jgi:hypothetical protein
MKNNAQYVINGFDSDGLPVVETVTLNVRPMTGEVVTVWKDDELYISGTVYQVRHSTKMSGEAAIPYVVLSDK